LPPKAIVVCRPIPARIPAMTASGSQIA
jgi:hypothetical protein